MSKRGLLKIQNPRKLQRSKKKESGGCGGSKSNEIDLLELNKSILQTSK